MSGGPPAEVERIPAIEPRSNRAPAANDALHEKKIISTVVQGRPFGEWRAVEITREALDAFRAQRPRVAGNRNLALLRALFNWGVAGGLLPGTPFRVGHVPVVKLAHEEARTRRLQAGEEERLLLAANGLAPLIVAALETGCRRGELLSLQWSQVGKDLLLPAVKTKARKDRRVPISKTLRTLLDGAGTIRPHSPSAGCLRVRRRDRAAPRAV